MHRMFINIVLNPGDVRFLFKLYFFGLSCPGSPMIKEYPAGTTMLPHLLRAAAAKKSL